MSGAGAHTRESLEAMFAASQLPAEMRRTTLCTDLAVYAARSAGGVVKGYNVWDNPTAEAAPASCNDGHDFALVGGRFVVDIWARDVELTAPRAVYDLHDPADLPEALRLFGPPERWEDGPAV